MNPHNIRLVALDMDGTLLHEDKHISRRTLQTVQKLADAGIRVVPATGRGLDGLRGTILQVSPIYHAICSNGAAIQDPASGAVLEETPIPIPEAIRLLEYYRERPLFFYLHTSQGPIRPEGWKESGLAARFPYLRFDTSTVPDLIQWLRGTDASLWKIGVFPHSDQAFREMLREGSPLPSMKLMRTGECNIEINSVHASKGNALKSLCARLDIPMSSVLAIGDNQNDIEMLRFAGVSVAMGNAQEDVKSAARFVTGSNEEDGAAEFLERYFWG